MMDFGKTLSLDGAWLLGVQHDTACRQQPKASTMAALLQSGVAFANVAVPGNVEQVLVEDMHRGFELLKVQELEMNHYYYVKTFSWTFDAPQDSVWITFEGIDTAAEVYLNGQCIGEVENMLIAHRLQAKGLVKGENELLVHIIPTVIAARKYEYPMLSHALKYNHDSLYVRKAPYMFGWDIFPRVISAGIFRPVSIAAQKPQRILQHYLYTQTADEKSATLQLFYELEATGVYADYRLEVEGRCGDSAFAASQQVWSKANRLMIKLDHPKRWWPRGRGEQNQYDVTIRLFEKEKLVDEVALRAGIRTLRLDRTSTTDENGSGEFCYVVNDERIFILGTNWVPLDSLPAQAPERMDRALALMDEIGCNAVRVWGGGYYQDDAFYDWCDEHGVLVWQDFVMACGIYPQDEAFAKKLDTEVRQIVRRLRQHPSLLVWAGDNECDEFWLGLAQQDGEKWSIKLDPNRNKLTRGVIADALIAEDFVRPYLPSSPYIDEACYAKGSKYASEAHLWGPRDYFKGEYYLSALAHFASETGYHGCPAPSSMAKFIEPEYMWPWQDNKQWQLHASSASLEENEPYLFRIKLMASQIAVLFGKEAENLDEFAFLSQVSQAEAMKFFIERFRMSKWRRTGIMWWNLLDGCPQFSDAVVDYYFAKKLAFEYIRKSQQPICLMMDEPKDGKCALFALNDTPCEVTITYSVKKLLGEKAELCTAKEATLAPDSAVVLAHVDVEAAMQIYAFAWSSAAGDGENHYVCGGAPWDAKDYVQALGNAGFLIADGLDSK